MDLTLKVNLECLHCIIGSDVHSWHIPTLIRLANGGYVINQIAVLSSQFFIPLYDIIIRMLLRKHSKGDIIECYSLVWLDCPFFLWQKIEFPYPTHTCKSGNTSSRLFWWYSYLHIPQTTPVLPIGCSQISWLAAPHFHAVWCSALPAAWAALRHHAQPGRLAVTRHSLPTKYPSLVDLKSLGSVHVIHCCWRIEIKVLQLLFRIVTLPSQDQFVIVFFCSTVAIGCRRESGQQGETNQTPHFYQVMWYLVMWLWLYFLLVAPSIMNLIYGGAKYCTKKDLRVHLSYILV